MKFISDKGLDELKRYQYKSGGYTTIDNLMNGFWFGISERLPLWLAPNLITFLGFLIMVTASACQIYYDTTFTKDIPRWTFWLMAFAIFAYQTLDAVDGKQARRTKSSSPLGQLFDHGCDSFILTFFGLAMAQACKVDKDFFFWIFLNVQLCEWAINQKEHITGILNTNLGNFGVTELEFICIGVEITAAIFGQDLLTKEFFGFVLYKIVFMPILIAAVVANIYMFITNIISSKNRLEAILEWIPIFLHVSCQFAWLHSNIYSQLAAPILLLFGLILSLITCKVIVCSVTKDHFPLFHVELIPFIIFTLLIQFGNFSYDNNIKLFWAAFVIESTLIFIFLRGVILQILQHLNIYLFKIAKL